MPETRASVSDGLHVTDRKCGLAKVVPRVPPVGDLDRVGYCFADGFGVGAGPVSAHDLYSGVGLQPRGHGQSRFAA
jgi:hypothetical protein